MKECARFAPRLTAKEGELSAEERGELERHLAGCEECRRIEQDLRAVEGLVGHGLTRAAARRDFSGFADQVMARVAAEEPGPGALRRLGAWFRAHRVLAVGTALAPVAAAAALVIYLSESGPSGPPVGEVDVVTEGRSATVLRTSDGPVVLIGDDEPT
ncbi:MAG TPA: zf-HC2 domain-containing protein [Anaeromyxobacteraceae bacterium]|nr:zf-HC2 domain-containing protein [Anaeromyxobacteraceae bacterium]